MKMTKEIKILIEMAISNKDNFTSSEIASFLNLKYTEGIYPYLKKLKEKDMINKTSRGEYNLNKNNQKIQDIIFLTNIAGKKSEILFTSYARIILEKFSNTPIIKKTRLPKKSLQHIGEIAKHIKIIHKINDQYFIACWEETTKKLLNFFDIKLKFDEDEFKHKITKFYSSMSNTNSPLDNENQKDLKLQNMKDYLSNNDFLLNKIKETDFPFLAVSKILTEQKNKEFSNNPFIITYKINEWKMKYIYNTDRIEGNPLSMHEVKTILTIGGLNNVKDKKAVLETINSRTALDIIFDINNEMNEDFIKKLHLATQYLIDEDAGKYKTKENCITDESGTLIDTTTPAEFVEQRMNGLIKWYKENKNKLNPFVMASIVHNQFVYIHPFNDGNGRVARLLFNFLLIKNGLFPIIFYNDEKQKYYQSLRFGKTGDIKPFVAYVYDLYRVQLGEF